MTRRLAVLMGGRSSYAGDHVELSSIGTRLLTEGYPDLAADALRDAIRARPDYGPARNKLGLALEAMNRPIEAAAEFEAIVEHAPTNDYALFCLGRSLQQLGRHAEARHPLALAANLQPQRADYKKYLEQAHRRAA